ncbi:hypothetical protein IEQ34_022007 [Dendrobium chrysotoxum]|uniref:Uncharacterized protein n=1 Tax=Dendrobium chrysotoxum TaxID=161865 RepID=A0AAV7FXU5_DENCH|nr:hypothetical protein IEQ34_022007 [Dendrobium chrysotoxum]
MARQASLVCAFLSTAGKNISTRTRGKIAYSNRCFEDPCTPFLACRIVVVSSACGFMVSLLYCVYVVCTQRSWKRPYGVGLLVAGLDETGAHLYYNCPSGNYFEYQAFAIGSRSQAAKTYLERRFDNFDKYSCEELIKDGLLAIKETLQGEKLTSAICTVAIVGVGEPFHIINQQAIEQVIQSLDIVEDDQAAAVAAESSSEEPSAAQEQGASPMELQ